MYKSDSQSTAQHYLGILILPSKTQEYPSKLYHDNNALEIFWKLIWCTSLLEENNFIQSYTMCVQVKYGNTTAKWVLIEKLLSEN